MCVNLCMFIYRVMIYFIFCTLHDKQSCFVINSLSFLIKCAHFYQAKPHFICGLYNAVTKYVCNKDLLYEGRVTSSVTIPYRHCGVLGVPLIIQRRTIFQE